MDSLVIHVLNSLVYASVVFLTASGLSLIYGVMRIINLAHGNLYALGAYTGAWVMGGALAGLPLPLLYLLLPVGAVAAGALGAVLEPTLFRPLYRRAVEYQILLTLGLLYILEDFLRFVWGPHPAAASALFVRSGSVSIGESIYPAYNVAVIVVGILAAGALWAFVYRTWLGVILRATSENMRVAAGLGVNVNRVYVQAFVVGCFMAGLGGATIVPRQAATLGMGVDALVLAFIVVVIGGLGSFEGALVGSLIVGVVREFGIAFFPEIELAVLYLMAVIVLLLRPAGLFGRA